MDATPLLAGTTQVIDRPPAQATQVLPSPAEPKRRNWVPIVVTLILIALLGGLLWFLATNLLSDENNQTGVLVEVPNVVGKSRPQAESDLEDAGFVPVVADRVPATGDQQPGTVLEQDPKAGDQVERGSNVNLTIVGNPTTVQIPDLQGRSVADAQAALTDAGLVPGAPTEEPSDTVDQGLVTRTDPAAGQEVERGSTVTIFVSTGPEQVTVPLVTCQSFGSAQNEIEKAGLTPVISQETVPINPQCPHGNKVAAQDPSSGTPVAPGTTVTLFSGAPTPTGPTGETGG